MMRGMAQTHNHNSQSTSDGGPAHSRRVKRRNWQIAFAVLLVLGASTYYLATRFITALPIEPGVAQDAPSELARWPWRGARQSTLGRGTTHWFAKQQDGTTLDLIEFDFAANPHLRWEIFDQDEDDEKPFDNEVKYFPRGVAQATRQLNQQLAAKKQGQIVAAWNGLFFGYLDPLHTSANSRAHHVSPVVLNGKVYFNSANHRWTFGVKYTQSGPQWKMFHLPTRQLLERELDWGGGSAQCLVKDGKPLKMEPFPRSRADFKPQPVASTPEEAGHIPEFDHMKTCRASLAWTRDNKKLYLLFVKEPDIEMGSAVALKQGIPLAGGWTVPDVQRFWLSKKVWGAMNSDAGDVGQLVFRRADSRYTMVPPRWGSNQMRLNLKPDFSNAPRGGAIMYFYVRDTSLKDS
jgi:hypothetical protein